MKVKSHHLTNQLGEVEVSLEQLIDNTETLIKWMRKAGGEIEAQRVEGYFLGNLTNYRDNFSVMFGLKDLQDDVEELVAEMEEEE